MPTNNQAERIIAEKFSAGKSFSYKNNFYKIILSGKPSYSTGEGKTDLYLKVQTNKHKFGEFKLSIKKDNFEFLENKIKKERAIEILGPSALSIITASALELKDQINKENKFVEIKADKTFNILLGWKIELFFNTQRRLKAKLNLSNQQKIEVLCGTNLPIEKKNVFVAGQKINDAGVANYILEIPSDISSLRSLSIQDLADKFKTPTEVIKHPEFEINAGFTALNYRSVSDKWDGPRPLAIWINWQTKNDKLVCNVEFDTPLELDGNDVGFCLRKTLKLFNIASKDSKKLEQIIDNPKIIQYPR